MTTFTPEDVALVNAMGCRIADGCEPYPDRSERGEAMWDLASRIEAWTLENHIPHGQGRGGLAVELCDRCGKPDCWRVMPDGKSEEGRHCDPVARKERRENDGRRLTGGDRRLSMHERRNPTSTRDRRK